MLKILNSLNWLYQQIRKEPRFIVNRPWLLFLFPIFIFLYIIKRWKTQPEIIYLIETELDKLSLLERRLEKHHQIIEYRDFQQILKIINQRIDEENKLPGYIDEVKARFARGDYLVALIIEQVAASFAFISESKAYFTQVKYAEKLDNNCFAVYDVYTFRNFRRKCLYEILLAHILQDMKNKDYEKFWLWVMKHNQVSIKVHHKLEIYNVIRIYKEIYRFGFRFFSKRDVNINLSNLIE